MRLPEPGDSLRLGVTLVVDGSPLLVASVRGSRTAGHASGALAAYSARFPLVPVRVSLLIRWQGIRLLARRVPRDPRARKPQARRPQVTQ